MATVLTHELKNFYLRVYGVYGRSSTCSSRLDLRLLLGLYSTLTVYKPGLTSL